jgi:ubiquinone/menaquinone biosynthesis C-methylase UbiE
MSFWNDRVLPLLIEKACRNHVIREERKRWIPQAHGRVLELGVGSGLNLPFYDAARARSVTAIDPSAALLAKARPRASAAAVPVELLQARAEKLPFADNSFDSAVITYSLCSIPEPAAALTELRRVLIPGGELYFAEHGRAPDADARRWQDRLTPLWSRVSGGCQLNRDPFASLEQAGFGLDQRLSQYSEGPRWLSFGYQGKASSRKTV